jgi:phosphoenolpyruvate synthase/pyruvate phosphate dikinase
VAVDKEGHQDARGGDDPADQYRQRDGEPGAIVRRVAEEVFKEKGRHVHYLVGTMIELPRACLVADEIAKEAEFFSFGTNDLTQTTFGFSRDDVGKILTAYLAEGNSEAGSVCRHRPGRCRRAGERSGSSAGARRGPSWRSGSAASMAAIRRQWSSAIR